MKQLERRGLEELVAMYQLEPSIRDVYVEGGLDEALVEWFFAARNVGDVDVTEINAVEISADLVLARGLENNNRGRLIALAGVMERHLGPDAVAVTCLVDADFDRVLEKNNDCRLLLMTDFSSMELYFFDVPHLTKFLRVVVRKFPKAAADVIAEIQEPLKDLFAIRTANYVLGWNLPLIPFEKCCKVTRTGVRLDVADYMGRFLNADGRRSEKMKFERVYTQCKAKFKGDVRNFIHGHDLLHLLAWYIRQHKGHNLSRETVERSFFSCAESNSLGEHMMFRQLLERTRAG
jgi:hypothetical protein